MIIIPRNSLTTSSIQKSPLDALDPKTERAHAVAERAERDTFAAATTTSSLASIQPRATAKPPSVGCAAPPSLPGRSQVVEMDPMAAHVAPLPRSNGLAHDLDSSVGADASRRVALDNESRAAALRIELGAQIGREPSSARGKSTADFGGDYLKTAIEYGAVGAATGARVGGGQGAIVGAFTGALTGLLREAVGDAVEWARKRADASNDPPVRTPPPPSPSETETEGDPADAGVEGKAASAGGVINRLPGVSGDGRAYERAVEAYFGQAAGTAFALRHSGSAQGGAADPRKSNPRPDAEPSEPSSSEPHGSIADGLKLSADPLRTARDDARAAHLMDQTRVGGRVIITDSGSDPVTAAGGRPRGSGLV